jgi:hypothetical protein
MHSILTEEQVNEEHAKCMDQLKGNNTKCYWAISWFIGNIIKNTEELKKPLKKPFLDRISSDNKISLAFCLSCGILSCAMLIIITGLWHDSFTSAQLTTLVGLLIGGSTGSISISIIIKFWTGR